MNTRYFVARSDHWLARAIRRAIKGLLRASLPAPRIIFLPIVHIWAFVQLVLYHIKRKLISEPFLKARCERYGRNLQTGHFVHWVSGRGDILLGDDVVLDGKIDIIFATLFPERPRLEIGSRTYVNHHVFFSVARRITIGDDVYISANVKFLDSPGHPLDPGLRLAKRPPTIDQVRPITVEDNVWIGMDVTVLPGVTIGEASVIATGSVVARDVPPYSLAGGVPAKVLRPL